MKQPHFSPIEGAWATQESKHPNTALSLHSDDHLDPFTPSPSAKATRVINHIPGVQLPAFAATFPNGRHTCHEHLCSRDTETPRADPDPRALKHEQALRFATLPRRRPSVGPFLSRVNPGFPDCQKRAPPAPTSSVRNTRTAED